MGTKICGIDISTFQRSPDFEKVKGAGIKFVMARAGFGGGTVDNQFHRNARECNRCGIPLGVYWFSYALNPDQARQEARKCLEVIKDHRIEYPICYDFEYDSVRYAKECGVTMTWELLTSMADAFLQEIERGGYYAMLYSNVDFSKNKFGMEQLRRYDLWYADYSHMCHNYRAGIWQYSNSGRINGIAGTVDLNYALRDYPAMIKAAGLNHL